MSINHYENKFFVFFLLAVLLCLTTCSKDKVDDEDTNISLNQSSISLYNESTFQLIGTNVTHWETKMILWQMWITMDLLPEIMWEQPQ